MAEPGPRTTEEKVQMLVDVHEVQNLFSRFMYLHLAGMNEETADCFAQETPGTRAEFPTIGIYDGIDSIRNFYVGAGKHVEGDRIGHLHLHTLTTPVIEVARDGKTAKGVWISPGVETQPGKDDIIALWHWIKYGVDFVKENGEWKMWKYHIYRLFTTPPGQSWAEPGPVIDFKFPPELRPDRPSSNTWVYSPDVATEHVPAPPDPYDTWDESRAYVQG
jgi:hypothetical protein